MTKQEHIDAVLKQLENHEWPPALADEGDIATDLTMYLFDRLESAQAEIARLTTALDGTRNNCTYLLSCIDMSNEAGAPPDELDAEDQAEIAAIREGNQP